MRREGGNVWTQEQFYPEPALDKTWHNPTGFIISAVHKIVVDKLRNTGLGLRQTENSRALSDEKTLENLWQLGLLCFQFAPLGFTAITAASRVPSACTAMVPVTTCPDTATACLASLALSATKVPPEPPPFLSVTAASPIPCFLPFSPVSAV